MKKILFAIAIAWSITGCNHQAKTADDQSVSAIIDKGMEAINAKEVRDNIDQYNVALKGDDEVDICVKAGLVKESYLRAKDNSNYEIWSGIEKSDCKNAGL